MNATDTESWSNPALWLQQLYFLPGDYLLELAGSRAPALAAWLQIQPGDHGGSLSAAVSLVAWLALILGIRALRDFVRLAVRQLRTLLSTLRLAVQARWFMTTRAWQRFISRFRRTPGTVVEGIDLNPLDAAILAIEAGLEPGFSLTAPDLAEQLGVRPAQAQRSLEKLRRYQLVTESFGTMDGFDGYQITQSGRFVVTASGLTPASMH